jgi:putative membrane protein
VRHPPKESIVWPSKQLSGATIVNHAGIKVLINAVRGGLIGVAEVIPGVSGGTIALIVGVYEQLIDGAGHLARGAANLIADVARGRGTLRAKTHFSAVKWGVVLPIAAGMLVAIVVAAALVAPLIESQPEATKAVFAGLIVASLIVPIRMAGLPWRVRDIVLAAGAAALTFFLTGFAPLPSAQPPLVLVGVAAAFAICALVLPGVSGSFLLLTLGMYAPTLNAVNERDFVYLGVFALGALIGLGFFVSGLQWLLANHHRLTLVVMTGLMAGSLRALWPWQNEENVLLAPAGDVVLFVALFVAGAIGVLVLIFVETRLAQKGLIQNVVPEGTSAN